MDNLINLGTKAFKQYSDKNNQTSQGDHEGNNNNQQSHQHENGVSGGYGVTGGAHLNRPSGGQNEMIDSDGDGIPDFQEAANQAAKHSDGETDSSVFDKALGFLKNRSKQDKEGDIDESRATDAHDRAYNKGEGGSLDASSMGAAAALQAFKQFTSGGGDATSKNNSGGGGQSKLIGMAMAQAAKLFDKSGGAASGQKQDAVNSAGEMIMKLVLKQKMNSMMGGGNSGGLSSLSSMAGSFLK